MSSFEGMGREKKDGEKSLPFEAYWDCVVEKGTSYLHPASLRRWAYILPISPMPMMPIEASSLVRPIATSAPETSERYDVALRASNTDNH